MINLKLPLKVYPFFVFVIFLIDCNANDSYSKNLCETTSIYDDNNKNDTSKVVFKNRVVFDTTANRISGFTIDRVTKKPILGAWVLINKDSIKYVTKTDSNGKFVFFKNDFAAKWQLLIRHTEYRCLFINGVNIEGGQNIMIKLSSLNLNQRQ